MIQEIYSIEVPFRGVYRLQRLRFGRGRPHLAVVAGLHGNELNGIYALNLLAGSLAAQAPAGTVDLIPLANAFGIEEGRKHGPFDDQDLNRAFPGNPSGTAIQRVAYALSQATQADCCLDVHSGSWLVDELAQVRPPLDGAEVDLARAMGLPLVWRRSPRPGDESQLVDAWRQAGCRAFRVTGGRGATFDKEVGLAIANGVRRLMARLGMGTAPPGGRVEADITGEQMQVLRSSTGGFFVPEVAVGDAVHPGHLLGRVVAPVGGATLGELRAERAGLVATLRRYPMVHAQELLLRVASPQPE